VELYARPLVRCIRDGRTPQPEEVATLSQKVLVEGVAHLGVQDGRQLAQRMASVAL
jgi:hypothetical protein